MLFMLIVNMTSNKKNNLAAKAEVSKCLKLQYSLTVLKMNNMET